MRRFGLIPAPFQEGAQKIADALKRSDRVLISGHVNADGDSVASLTAGGLILRALGKQFALYAAGIPDYLSFVSLPGAVYSSLRHIPFIPQSALIVDCSDTGRMNAELAGRLPDLAVINVDHHIGSNGLGAANWIQPEAAATAQLMAYVALACDLPLVGELADAVAVGLVSDTGGFSHGNTDKHVFSLAACLASGGCDIPQLRENLEANWTLGQMRLWSRLMRRACLLHNGAIAFCNVHLRDFRECGTAIEHLEGFVEQLRRLRGVRIAALLREDKPGMHKYSLRSFGSTNVQAIAARLNGGGHTNAAGGTLYASPGQAKKLLLAAITRQLDSEESPTLPPCSSDIPQ
ncbi:MAG: bifunctional oligoribonuclease/PAP phosphatase NrnA [Desulfovibrio sp.]|jgi:phosphoesterase RecJ-like protein|nr:bifunctional oligoribonuclease/PAP phosphatase NrnA [Desulfovibrio sp.]